MSYTEDDIRRTLQRGTLQNLGAVVMLDALARKIETKLAPGTLISAAALIDWLKESREAIE